MKNTGLDYVLSEFTLRITKLVEEEHYDPEQSAPALLIMLEVVTDAIQHEILQGQYAAVEQAAIMDEISRALSHILCTAALNGMPKGQEYLLPGKLDLVAKGMDADRVNLMRDMLKMNEIPDPWEQPDTNRQTFQEILRELGE